MDSQIQIKINNEEKEMIKKVAKLLSIGYSTFCRQVSMKETRKILQENQLEAIKN